MRKVAGAAVVSRFLAALGLVSLLILGVVQAQDIPDNELQVDFNTYFDSFNVQVIYPSISYTRKVSENTSINARYLVDLVTAASIRSNVRSDGTNSGGDDKGGRGGESEVDGVSSASRRGEGYKPDDVRHVLGFGVTRAIVGGVISVNGLYSKEFDYRSSTIAGTYSTYFVNKNTNLQLGFVRNWDANSPKIFDWTKHKNEQIFSATLTQVLSKRLIAQAIFFYDHSTGLLSDPYQVVQINQNGIIQELQTVHPGKRIRKAGAARVNYKLTPQSALHVGMRYYWDDWDVKSLTTSIRWDKHINNITTIGFGFRSYLQSRAYFVKERYLTPEEYMTVDSKLDRSYSDEVEFKLMLNGGEHFDQVPFLMNENVQFHLFANLYHRHTATANWFSNSKNLISFIMGFGIRYRF